MEETVKISILIPAYNVECYIDQCLESLMNQTLREIEIIAVDDGSTDGTLAHLEAAAEKDGRVRIIRHTENLGTMRSRKDAVLASRGEYIMFVDGDDYLELDACRTVYESAVKAGADILQFGVCVENCGNLPVEISQRIERVHNRYQTGEFLGEPLVQNFYKDRISITLWQKAVKGETAKRAFRKMPDVYMRSAEDIYIIAILLMESKSLSKIPEKLYHYCYGHGMFGRRIVPLQELPLHCGGVITYQELKKYVTALAPECGEEYISAGNEAVKRLKRAIINNQVNIWLNRMRPEDQPEAFLMIEESWQKEASSFVGLLAQSAWEMRAEVAKAIAGADWLKFEGRPIKTIGLYYWKFRNGGAQRVIAQLGSMLAELRDEEGKPKYRVVLISDEAPQEEDYPISPLMIREQLPPFQESTAEKYASRADKWQEIISRHHIDAVLYSQWANPNMLWDLLSVKRAEGHPAFVIHTHSWFAILYEWKDLLIKQRQDLFRLADGIVTLSELDRRYWLRVNPRSVYIPNPCFVKASECRRASYGKHILWLGRISDEKQPLEILRIMREVYARDPEIVCHVVGANDVNLENRLKESIAAEGLSERVIMEGFHADVTPYYENCSIFLVTSRYEGFSLTMLESAAHGLPTVLYELPWTEYNKLINGAIAVPQLDAEAAAEAIVRIVNDPEEWQRRSDAIYDSARRFEETDIAAYWVSLLESLEKGTLPEEPRFDRETEMLLDQIDVFHDRIVMSLTEEKKQDIEKLRKWAANRQQRVDELVKEREEKKQDIEKLRKWAENRQQRIDELVKEREEKSQDIEKLRKWAENRQQRIDELVKEREEKNQNIEKLRKWIDNRQQRIDELVKEREEKNQIIEKLRKWIDNRQQLIDELRDQLNKAKADAAKANEEAEKAGTPEEPTGERKS